MEYEEALASSSRAIDSSNIGFKLLKKQGWREGTGLGASEQGRLEPIQTHLKTNKRGLGSEEEKKKVERQVDHGTKVQNNYDDVKSRKKQKAASKRIRKMLEDEERLKEKEFERAFFREFWPDNV